MKTLLRGFQIFFWLFILLLLLFVVSLFSHEGRESTTYIAGNWAFRLAAICGLIYSVFVGLLADKYGKNGGAWGAAAFFFAPLGILVTYIKMRSLISSGAIPTGKIASGYTPSENKWHLKLIVIFIAFVVVVNIAIRLFK